MNGSWHRLLPALVAAIGPLVLAACDDVANDQQGLNNEGVAAGGSAGDGSTPQSEEPSVDLGDEGPPASEETGEIPAAVACDEETKVEMFLSPDDSNSMSSPVQARAAVLDGLTGLSAVPIRTWEFLNYYTFGYSPAPAGELRVTPSLLHEDGMAEGEYILQIGVSSERVVDDVRPPMNITLVLDTSGSMSGHPLDMLKETCRAIAASLREGDVISIVTWNTENTVVLANHVVTGSDDLELLQRIDAISADGGTDLHGGLVAGYALAMQTASPERTSRIVLVSDGGANVGITDETIIAQHAGNQTEDGIDLVGVGVGTANSYNDLLMDTVTDVGKGASVFIPDPREARKIFAAQFINTLAVAARDVQVKVELPPGFKIVRFSGEEFGTDPADIEAQHLAPNDAMVFHQRIETCAPALLDEDAAVTVTVRYVSAATAEAKESAVTVSFNELLQEPDPLLLKGAAVFEYAEALKAYRSDPGSVEGEAAVSAALAALARAQGAAPADNELIEIRTVLEAL